VRIVKCSRTIQDQSLSLLCLGILRIFAQDKFTPASNSNADVRAFFTGSKALKSLNLAVLQAAWITKAAHGISKVDVLRSLNIAFQIIDATPAGILERWRGASDGQRAISSLISQCLNSSTHADTSLKVITPTTACLYSAKLL
jgi:hypothetical protein